MTNLHNHLSAATDETPPDWKQDQAETSRLPRHHLDASKWPSKATVEASHARLSAGSEAENWARLGASEYACYRWPEDTAEHRAMRAAFMDGAAHAVTRDEPQAAWQPIETAPKDQCILVAAAHRLRPHRIAWWSERQFAQHGNGWAFDGDGFITPLAWQPLPDASQVTRPEHS